MLTDTQALDTTEELSATDETVAPKASRKEQLQGVLRKVRPALADARIWFRGFRRSRPFWGGLWMLVGAYFLLDMSMVPIQVIVSAGLTGLGGYITGGGLLLCGLAIWFFPSQKLLAGVIGLLLAIVSIVISNLGGMFLGMFFGVIGSSMALGWGPAKPRAFGKKAKAAAAAEAHDIEPESNEIPA